MYDTFTPKLYDLTPLTASPLVLARYTTSFNSNYEPTKHALYWFQVVANLELNTIA